ncbi:MULTISPECIES: aminotransferase class I/II-fold pyridoxal phosphate-dependent enzyme [unclassified Acinetobacter]|uniref:aminotransferase class I/II-fold pyridoxal phosphate-dependent enzyme n=1 Tax=unclassified Acinetobacter TaxID=196816 RepID=UPI0035B9B294
MSHLYQSYVDHLEVLKQKNNYRFFKKLQHDGQMITVQFPHQNKTMLNLSSNDYLGLAQRRALKQQFLDEYPLHTQHFSSSSSRLLTGNFEEYERLEHTLNQAFGRDSLIFNSGYHMNIGILPALTNQNSLIISDELIHASIIDGIRLSKAKRERYLHQDLNQLEQLIITAMQDDTIDKIFIVTESIFSMDGDMTDLTAFVQLKQKYSKVLLYVDDAHGVGVYGEKGLGCAEHFNCIHDIDFLVGTFGKALASVGGYLICDTVIRDYLINTMRSLIFSTAQAPINMAWTDFIFQKMQQYQQKRQHLQQLSHDLKQSILQRGLNCPSDSHIVPVIYGENHIAIEKANIMQDAGFYVLPIRPPTVAVGTARVRICLNAELNLSQIEPLFKLL